MVSELSFFIHCEYNHIGRWGLTTYTQSPKQLICPIYLANEREQLRELKRPGLNFQYTYHLLYCLLTLDVSQNLNNENTPLIMHSVLVSGFPCSLAELSALPRLLIKTLFTGILISKNVNISISLMILP